MTTQARPRSFWPYGLIITFVVFISWLAVFVAIAVSGRMDLERADYYEQTIRYQDQIDRAARGAGVRNELAVAYEPATGSVQLRIPAEHARRKASGMVTFYRPSDARMDRDIPLAPDVAGRQSLDVSGWPAGHWKLRVAWQVDGQDYYFDDSIVVKPHGS